MNKLIYKLSVLWNCYSPMICSGVLLLLLIIFCGCSSKVIQTEQRTEVIYKDSTILHIDTVHIDLPKQSITDCVSMWDSLFLNTDVAEAVAYVDYNTNTLKGTLKNKGEVKTVVQYQDRIVYKDSLVYIDRPKEIKTVEYKAPRWMIWYVILSVLGALIMILIKKKTWIINNLVRTFLLKN